MKKTHFWLACTLLSLTSVQSQASTAELTVEGTIVPNACLPTLDGGGRVDYGVLAVGDLRENQDYYILPEKQINFAITCNSPTLFAVKTTDNRYDSSLTESTRFGLGQHEGQSIGNYGVGSATSRTQLDGQPAQGTTSTDNGQNWNGPRQIFWLGNTSVEPGYLLAYTHTTAAPPPATSLNSNLLVYSFIDKRLNINSDVRIDGSATLEIVYL
ncbi:MULTISPECIES: DUF1120 domain-containing protein [Pseudomonas]|uniref:Protein GltF n=1 Tax=Pseudomonas fluorescens TaxID=294 RepID=A0A5E6VGH6_PSEFL|nr:MULTISPECIES: DUF1120 domain-containing protein [Pseudomonas]VVN16830.1 Protein GltF [Pseudomonas fluorescens]